MTLHELTVAMETNSDVFYIDDDGEMIEVSVESIEADGTVIIDSGKNIYIGYSQKNLLHKKNMGQLDNLTVSFLYGCQIVDI